MKTRRNQGFTLIELLVVITIIAILASIAVPVYNTVTEKARIAKMTSNVKQIVLACRVFAVDWDGNLPAGALDTGATTTGATGTGAYAVSGDAWEDLYFSGTLTEPLYWTAGARKCAVSKPTVNAEIQGTVVNSNNYVSYIENLTDGDAGGSVLCYEGDDAGVATDKAVWTKTKAHPWTKSFIAGYLDGSAAAINLNTTTGAPVGESGTSFLNVLKSVGAGAGTAGYVDLGATTAFRKP